MAETTSESMVWISDTGASHHMTKSSAYFASYTSFNAPKAIIVGNQHTMLAYGYGDIRIEALVDGVWYEHYLKDVWYVPDVVKNLFSVTTATDKGFVYRQDKQRCELVKDGKPLLTGERYHSLYKLHIRPVLPETPAEVLITHKVDTLQVWHERLGHQCMRYVENFLKTHDIKYVKDGNQLCESCVMGKHHRLSLGRRLNASEKPGDLVYADVCGPMEVNSFSGFRYYVIFKDDFSKYRCVYFLKQKSEVHEKLKQFLAETKIAGHVVKELLTDGGGKFNNKCVSQIVNDCGIYHRMTMPYTPEQNGAERENRTVMEAARSMLHSSKLPNKLLAEQ